MAILPGSRTQEVTHNLRFFLKAAAIVRRRVPDVRFAIAAFKPHQAEIARRMVGQSGWFVVPASAGNGGQIRDSGQPAEAGTTNVPVEVCVGKTPELMRLADCAMSVSGSVSLELLYHTTPTVILYWISRPAYFVQRFFLQSEVHHAGEPAGGRRAGGEGRRCTPGSREYGVRSTEYGALRAWTSTFSVLRTRHSVSACVPFPEYLTCEDKSAEIAGHIIEWLTDPAARAARVGALAALRAQVAHGGASRRAAEYILDVLAGRPPLRRPHYPAKQPATAL